jgi:glycosyltransferase involved in cell wall biosynthesis
MTIVPIVSIVTVAAYEDLRLLRTLESLSGLGASVEHLLVVPNDDVKSIAIWKSAIKKLEIPMRIIHDNNEGIYNAMNLGIQSSLGKYVCFWNAGDELFSPENMNKLISNLESSKHEWLIFQGDFSWHKPLALTEFEVKDFLSHKPNSFISHQCLVVRRDMLLSLKGFNSSFKVAGDTAQITQLFSRVKPDFFDLPVVKVEIPNIASKNHRRSRVESVVVALIFLRGSMRFRAISNIILSEISRIFRRVSIRLDR